MRRIAPAMGDAPRDDVPVPAADDAMDAPDPPPRDDRGEIDDDEINHDDESEEENDDIDRDEDVAATASGEDPGNAIDHAADDARDDAASTFHQPPTSVEVRLARVRRPLVVLERVYS